MENQILKKGLEKERALQLSGKFSKGDKFFPAKFVQELYDSVDNTRDKTYLMFNIETGLRINEVIGAEWAWIDRPNYRIKIYDNKKMNTAM